MTNWADIQYDVETALGTVLPQLPRPAPTVVVTSRVAAITGFPNDEVAKCLLAMARNGFPNATRNGVVKMRFGRQVTGWMWHATPQREGRLPVAEPPSRPGQPVTLPSQEQWATMSGEEQRLFREAHPEFWNTKP